MPELRRPTGLPNRPQPPTGPTGTALPRFPEPPALRSAPAGSPRVCTNCSAPVSFQKSPPLCWGCGRTLCVDCYWRHGLTPSAHTCAACLARGVTGPIGARSAGRPTASRAERTGSSTSV